MTIGDKRIGGESKVGGTYIAQGVASKYNTKGLRQGWADTNFQARKAKARKRNYRRIK